LHPPRNQSGENHQRTKSVPGPRFCQQRDHFEKKKRRKKEEKEEKKAYQKDRTKN